MMMLAAMLALLVAAAIVAIGLIVGLAAGIAAIMLFVSGAAFSSSLAGALRRSPSFGFTLFVIQMSAAAGAVLGAGAGLIISHIRQVEWMNVQYTGAGALTGLLLMALLGWATMRAWLEIWKRILRWWSDTRQPRLPEAG